MGRLTNEHLDIIARDTTDSSVRMLAKEVQERRAEDAAKFDSAVVVIPDGGGRVRRVFLTGREVEALDVLARAIAGSVAKTERVFGDALAVLQKLITRGNR